MGTVNYYIFSEEEIEAVRVKFPKLEFKGEGVWKGIIDVYAKYKEYPIIDDSFEVLIFAPSRYPLQLPYLVESGGRTKKIAEKHNITDLQDLHCNTKDNYTACLCARREEKKKFPPGSNLTVFIENLVIPYLYGLSYFEKCGKWAPWGELSHGALGSLEYHVETTDKVTEELIREISLDLRSDENWKYYNKQLRQPSGRKRCVCSSGEPFEFCHKKAWEGLLRLHAEISNFNLNANQLFHK